MKKILFFLSATIVALLFTSCKESNDAVDEYANWEQRNAEYFDNIYKTAEGHINGGNTAWKIFKSVHKNPETATKNTDHIVVEVLPSNLDITSTDSPIQSDSVRVFYQGRIIPTDSYPEGYIFDGTWTDKYNVKTMLPKSFALDGLIDGFSTAIQHMHKGDRWRVYMPQQLGYGAGGSGAIRAYSTLIFDITLLDFAHKGNKLPPYAQPATK